MLATKVSTLSIAAVAGSEVTMERGKFKVAQGMQAIACYLKITLGISNTTGGNVTLSDAQKQALFALILVSCDFGEKGEFLKIFTKHDMARVHREARRAFASEIEGYTDSSTGLAKSLINSATTNVTFFMPIPLGKLWWCSGKFKDILGVGPSLAELMEVKLRLTGLTIAANLLVNTAVTVDIMPDVVPCKYDKCGALPVYEEKNEVDRVLDGPEGMHIATLDRNAVHASAAFTNTSLEIGGQKQYDALASTDVVISLNDAALLPTIGSLTDRETVLYEMHDGERPFEQVPSGALRFTQNVKDVATVQAGFVYVPLIRETDWNRMAQVLASKKKRTVKLINVGSPLGLDMPERLRPYVPAAVVSIDDDEFEAYAGLACEPGGDPYYHIPDPVKAKAASLKAAYATKPKLSEAVSRKIAAQIPGAVQSGAGFEKNPSSAFNVVRGQLGR